MVKRLLLALSVALYIVRPAIAEDGANLGCFQGLNDSQTSATLPQCESPDLLNTESNLDATAILKRKGFSKFADLSVSTWPVNGSHSFIDSSGNRQDIVCQDTNCAKSTNGNAFALFLTTAAAGITRWSFVDQGGFLYGANNKRDPIMRWDGTTRTSPATMPAGSILELTQDRLAVGDISGQPNRVHYSSAGAYEMFTVGVNPEDSFFDDIGAAGDKVRGIKCIGGNCFIFKTASITLCEMANQYNTQCSVISPNIGTTDPASIVAAGSSLYFRAQDKNYWEITPSGLRQISKKIPNLVKSQSGGLGGGENTNTQTTQADWQAGVQNPLLSWNTTIVNGSIFPSSVTLVDTSSADFAGGTLTNLSLTDVVGSVLLSSRTFKDDFSDGNYTSNPVWTVNGGGYWQVLLNKLRFSGESAPTGINGSIYTPIVDSSSGSWTFNCDVESLTHGDELTVDYIVVSTGTDPATTSGYAARVVIEDDGSTVNSIYKINAGTFVLQSSVTRAAGTNFPTPIVIEKSGGNIRATFGTSVITAADTTYTAAGNLILQVTSVIPGAGVAHEAINFDNISWYKYQPVTGSITSRIFDTAFSTPTWGPLSSTYTANNAGAEGNIAFYTQVSTAGDGGGFDAAISSSDTLRVTSAQKRYIRYRADFTTFVSTKSPTLSDIALQAVTTGTFRTQCIQPNSTISSWGTLNCAQTLVGNGSEVFFATSAATCATLPTTAPQTWATTQTNNATVTIATNTAVYIGWRSLLGSTTDQAQVDSCVLAWNEGTPSQPAWGVYDSIKNAVYWTTTINNGAYSNRLLKYDRNLQQWYPFSIQAQAPRVINNSLYFGSASSGTWNLYGGVDSDAGGAVNAYWTSKDFGSASPFNEKSFKSLSIISRNNGSGSMTGTYTLSNSQTGSYTISLSTGTGINYARSNFYLPLLSPQQFLNVKVGNNSATPFEVLGIGLTWETKPWRVSGP